MNIMLSKKEDAVFERLGGKIETIMRNVEIRYDAGDYMSQVHGIHECVSTRREKITAMRFPCGVVFIRENKDTVCGYNEWDKTISPISFSRKALQESVLAEAIENLSSANAAEKQMALENERVKDLFCLLNRNLRDRKSEYLDKDYQAVLVEEIGAGFIVVRRDGEEKNHRIEFSSKEEKLSTWGDLTPCCRETVGEFLEWKFGEGFGFNGSEQPLIKWLHENY